MLRGAKLASFDKEAGLLDLLRRATPAAKPPFFSKLEKRTMGGVAGLGAMSGLSGGFSNWPSVTALFNIADNPTLTRLMQIGRPLQVPIPDVWFRPLERAFRPFWDRMPHGGTGEGVLAAIQEGTYRVGGALHGTAEALPAAAALGLGLKGGRALSKRLRQP